MSEGGNTNMYIGLAVLVAFIVYYYMFMMTPAPVAPATGTGAGTLTGAVANPATGAVVPVKCQIGFEMINGVCTAIKCPAGAFLNGSTCFLPANSIKHPTCLEKMNWMRNNWNKTDKSSIDFYKKNGVDGTDLSIYKYLANVEPVCPSI